MEVVQGSPTRTVAHRGWPGHSSFWVPEAAECWRPTASPWHGTIPLGNQPATCWKVYYTGLLSSWKVRCFVLTGIDTSAHGFAFPASNVSAKLPLWAQKCLIYHHSIPHSILLTKQLMSESEMCNRGPMPEEVVLPRSLSPWSSWPERRPHGSRNWGVEIGMAPVTAAPSDH